MKTLEHAGLRQADILKQVADSLQESLQEWAPEVEQKEGARSLQVKCAVKAEVLMVLVQHSTEFGVEGSAIFQHLEQAIPELPRETLEQLLPDLGIEAVPVKLYLRHWGAAKPYRTHQFELGAFADCELLDESLLELPPLEEDEVLAPPDLEPVAEAAENHGALVHQPIGSAAPIDPSETGQNQAALDRVAPWRRLAAVAENPLFWWVAGGGVAIASAVGAATFVLTRPCVVGECPPFQLVAQINQSAQVPAAATDLPEFRSERAALMRARSSVSRIPVWSRNYEDAEALRQSLELAIAAEENAEQAIQKGQAIAQPVTEWQAAQSRWREAIAALEAIPQTNPLFSYAQRRLITYRTHLATINQHIVTEQIARRRLLSAQKTATLAENRQNSAQQPRDWQLAQSTWQVVVNTLRDIPATTTQAPEAQDLLQRYQPKLDQVRDRATKEQNAQKAYLQATVLAQRAKILQKKGQWSQSALNWQSALVYAKQVPAETVYFDQAQQVIPPYTASLGQAQAMVKTRLELSRVCSAAGRICNYEINPNAIQVRFTPKYEQQVKSLKEAGWQSGSQETLEQINQHIASLESALQLVSNTMQLPIQVYNSSHQLVGSFSPQG